MTREKFHIDTDLHLVLTALDIVDYEITDEDGELFTYDGELIDEAHLNLTVTPDTHAFSEFLVQRLNYYERLLDDASTDEVMERIIDELNTGLDVEFNRVGRSVPGGEYRKMPNDKQWESVDDDERYQDYQELLFTVTEGKNTETLSVPNLYHDVVDAIVASDDYTLPDSPVVVENLILTHIRDIKAENNSRKAKLTLKKRLERNGMSPRRAADIAANMDDLLVADSELPTEEQQETSHE